jgi:hypothetical protein
LVVYPPGTSIADRRLARLWRAWPLAGAALALLAVILLADAASSPRTVLGVAVAAYVSIGALLFLRAGPTRVPVRSMSVMLMAGAVDARERRCYAEWETLADMLIRAEQDLRSGAIAPVDHEAIWWHAYDCLGEAG